MADAPQDDDFGKELAAAFAADEGVVENPATPAADDANKPNPDPATPPAPANVEEPKKDEPANPADPNKKDEELETPPADPAKPTEENPAAPKDPETPPAPTEEQPKPLTEEGVLRILNQARTEERNSTQELRNTYDDVLNAYYPEGLSTTLETPDGKKLETPQDVVDASNGEMTIEQATQWLMNEKYKLEQNVEKIQRQAAQIADTTVSFRRDSLSVLQKYEPLFTKYPQLQEKAFNLLMKQTKIDQEKGVVLSAPDVFELYDTYLEPYQQAYEFSTQQPATNPVTPAPATPGINDRLDENNDGGVTTEVEDPNDFAQQVTKALNSPF
jgi:hypothetical protein